MRTALLAHLMMLICIGLTAQVKVPVLTPNQAVTFSLEPNEAKAFSLSMPEGGFGEISWLANENLTLEFGIFDASGNVLESGDSMEKDAGIFVAPKAGDYWFVMKRGTHADRESEPKGRQNISLEYKNAFRLPVGSRQKGIRKINGYDVRIVYTPGKGDSHDTSWVLIEKAGKLKKLLKSDGFSEFAGFSFPDNAANVSSLADRRIVRLIQSTLDKTDDGIPDVMISHFSGGAHCCFSTYFIGLGEQIGPRQIVQTANGDLTPLGVNGNGGLRFGTHDNAFAYWNTSYAGSPLPYTIVEFENGELRANFELMKKPAPMFATLKAKARTASQKINGSRYPAEDADYFGHFEEAFWSEMLELIYTGNESLAWQYLDLVWPAKKPGKEQFLTDFKKQLAESYYGTRTIDISGSSKSAPELFQRIPR